MLFPIYKYEVSRFNCFALFGIHFFKFLFVFAINRQKYCKIGLVSFVGGPKKRREYVPREIWISSQSGVKKVPKRKILPVNRPETQKYSISPRKGMFSVDSLPVPQEWLNSPQLQGLIQTVVDNLQASLSADTWSNYGTAVNNLARCAEYLNIPLALPLDGI